jgi:DNA polymerase (family 10)
VRSHPLITSAQVRSPSLVVARTDRGTAVEIHVGAPASFGWCQALATGAPAHVEALRARAAARGVSIDGLLAPDERALYRALDLPWIPPEVRDGTDEIAQADAGDDFTDLVQLSDLTGAFHCHTTWSDGRHSVEAMARAAAERGLGLVTITDHSAAAGYAGGLDEARLRAQAIEIAEAAAAIGIRVLRGTEADILADGAIDVPPALVGELDVIIASVHQRYRQDEARTTARLIEAMRQPYFKIWGHALGRLILRRDPIPVRLGDVLDAAAESGSVAIELNGDPHRLDLAPEHVREAQARGLRFVLSTDAHATGQLDYAQNAVAMARRARLRRDDVLNTLPPDELAAAVRPKR